MLVPAWYDSTLVLSWRPPSVRWCSSYSSWPLYPVRVGSYDGNFTVFSDSSYFSAWLHWVAILLSASLLVYPGNALLDVYLMRLSICFLSPVKGAHRPYFPRV